MPEGSSVSDQIRKYNRERYPEQHVEAQALDITDLRGLEDCTFVLEIHVFLELSSPLKEIRGGSVELKRTLPRMIQPL